MKEFNHSDEFISVKILQEANIKAKAKELRGDVCGLIPTGLHPSTIY